MKWTTFIIEKNDISPEQQEKLEAELETLAKKYECEPLEMGGSLVLTDSGLIDG